VAQTADGWATRLADPTISPARLPVPRRCSRTG
jgi:hypothetical protein